MKQQNRMCIEQSETQIITKLVCGSQQKVLNRESIHHMMLNLTVIWYFFFY